MHRLILQLSQLQVLGAVLAPKNAGGVLVDFGEELVEIRGRGLLFVPMPLLVAVPPVELPFHLLIVESKLRYR